MKLIRIEIKIEDLNNRKIKMGVPPNSSINEVKERIIKNPKINLPIKNNNGIKLSYGLWFNNENIAVKYKTFAETNLKNDDIIVVKSKEDNRIDVQIRLDDLENKIIKCKLEPNESINNTVKQIVDETKLPINDNNGIKLSYDLWSNNENITVKYKIFAEANLKNGDFLVIKSKKIDVQIQLEDLNNKIIKLKLDPNKSINDTVKQIVVEEKLQIVDNNGVKLSYYLWFNNENIAVKYKTFAETNVKDGDILVIKSNRINVQIRLDDLNNKIISRKLYPNKSINDTVKQIVDETELPINDNNGIKLSYDLWFNNENITVKYKIFAEANVKDGDILVIKSKEIDIQIRLDDLNNKIISRKLYPNKSINDTVKQIVDEEKLPINDNSGVRLSYDLWFNNENIAEKYETFAETNLKNGDILVIKSKEVDNKIDVQIRLDNLNNKIIKRKLDPNKSINNTVKQIINEMKLPINDNNGIKLSYSLWFNNENIAEKYETFAEANLKNGDFLVIKSNKIDVQIRFDDLNNKIIRRKLDSNKSISNTVEQIVDEMKLPRKNNGVKLSYGLWFDNENIAVKYKIFAETNVKENDILVIKSEEIKESFLKKNAIYISIGFLGFIALIFIAIFLINMFNKPPEKKIVYKKENFIKHYFAGFIDTKEKVLKISIKEINDDWIITYDLSYLGDTIRMKNREAKIDTSNNEIIFHEDDSDNKEEEKIIDILGKGELNKTPLGKIEVILKNKNKLLKFEEK